MLSSDRVDSLEFNTEELGEIFVDITKVTFEVRGGFEDYGRLAADDIVVAQEPIAAVNILGKFAHTTPSAMAGF